MLNYSPGPTPCLHLEYVPDESVGDHLQAGRGFSRYECKQILAQTLEALAYLHTLDPQIVHRDVKPTNILVMYRRPDAIFVKFADFGLSREGDVLKTICGTCLYLAPEVYEASATILRDEGAAYTALVDVWSLGVVLAELVCGLPQYGRRGVEWCNRVRLWVKRMSGLQVQGDDLLSFLLDSMLCLRPDARKTATDCLNNTLLLLNHTDEESNGAVSNSYSPDNSENEASTIRLGEARKADSETTEPKTGDPGLRDSTLERDIISNPGRHVRSTNAPSPKATTVHIEQLLSKLENPEDNLFNRSSFGYGSDGGCSDSGGSSSASTITTKPQDGEVQGSPRSVLGLAAPPEIHLEATPPSDAVKDMGDRAEVAERTDTRRGNEADAAPSFKRPRTTR